MKLTLIQTCSCGEPGETVDVASVDKAQALVMAGAAEELPFEAVASAAPKGAKKATKKAAKKAKQGR